ncbi:MAG TPA: glycosyltransferase family 39 protein [Phycisphaerae bacterium]|nr:glycosyltransferase family 39 protein [Phycisphaerae bacterium]
MSAIPSPTSSISLNHETAPSRRAFGVFAAVWLAGTGFALVGGPHLAEHEVIVAQSARQMIASGDWLIPRYLDTPFLVKPPLAAWLVAGVSLVTPRSNDTAQPVTDFAARFPSAVAVVLTILLVWRLAGSMFDTRIAAISAVVCASSLGMLLFAVNATAEALLTLFCTWAFAEFWWAQTKPERRTMHLARFYIALGLGMLAKGPMPMMVVVVPLAAWWFGHRGIRRLTTLDPGRMARIVRSTLFSAGLRLKEALTTTGLWWGFPLFAAMFVPWMVLVARREPYAWALWDYEFLDRAKGDYPGCHWGDFLYYLPLLFGLLLPWCLSLPEALASPFLRVYRRQLRPLTYAWCWAVAALALLSIMSFKKPYYILPAVPGCAILLGPVLDRLFFRSDVSARLAKATVGVIVAILTTIAVVMWFVGRRMYPEEWHGILAWGTPLFAVLAIGGMAMAGWLYVRGRRWPSLTAVAMSGLVTFGGVWCVIGPSAGNIDAPHRLVEEMAKARVPDDVAVYWASNRPDGRVTFYWNRGLRQVVDPYKLMAERSKSASGFELRLEVAGRICELLDGPGIVYMVLQLEDFASLQSHFDPRARELCVVDRGNRGRDKDDWVVITNQGVGSEATGVRLHAYKH